MPTIKQKRAFDKMVGNGGNITDAMRQVNYSEATINTPQKLTESKGWQELMSEYLPDEDLARVHREGLEAGDKIIVEGKDTGIVVPDYGVRHKYLDSAYKLKGSYAPEKSVALEVKVDTKEMAEYLKLKEEFEQKAFHKITNEN